MTNSLSLTGSAPSLGSSPVDTSAATTYTDLNGLAALKKDPNSPQTIKAVAGQVEALFLQMMLKSMRDANASMSESDSNEMGMYQDMFDKQIALTMSQHQDLGLGSLLTRQMAARAAAATPARAAAHAPPRPAAAPPAVPAAAQPATSAPPTSMTQSAEEFVDQVLP